MNFTDEIQDILNRKQNPGTQNTDEETREAVRQLAEHTKRNHEELEQSVKLLAEQLQKKIGRQQSNKSETVYQPEPIEQRVQKVEKELEQHQTEVEEVIRWLDGERDKLELRVSDTEEKVIENEQEIETCIDYIEQETCENHDRIQELEQRIEHLEQAVTKNGEQQEETEETEPQEQEETETLSPDHYEMDERVEKIKQLLKNSPKGITREELAKKLYNRDEYGHADDQYQRRVEAGLAKLRRNNKIEKAGQTTRGNHHKKYLYKLKTEQEQQEQEEQEDQELDPSKIK